MLTLPQVLTKAEEVNPLPQPLSLPGRGEYSLPRSWNNVAPAWSPDGSQIAFLTDRTGHWEMWVMSADGSNQRPLFPDGTLDGLTLQYNNVDERMLSWR
jgi:hypothetical protein